MWGTRNTIQRSRARVREAEVQNASSARETSASIPIGDIIMLNFDHHLDTVSPNLGLYASFEGSLSTVDASEIDSLLPTAGVLAFERSYHQTLVACFIPLAIK